MRYKCYDIESLRDLFTLSVYEEGVSLEVYYLAGGPLADMGHPGWDWDETRRAIADANADLALDPSQIAFYDLSDVTCFARMVSEFGMCPPADARIVDGSGREAVARPLVRDTDPAFDESRDYFLLGFNSRNYDMTMLALLMGASCWWHPNHESPDGTPAGHDGPSWSADRPPVDAHLSFEPTDPSHMRDINNDLFSDEWRNDMRHYLVSDGVGDNGRRYGTNWDRDANKWYECMEHTGRNVDVARVGLEMHKAALKRLLGMLGYQILESSRLDAGSDMLESKADADDLIAYNASDVRNTLNLFDNPNFEGKFEVKSGLLRSYPDLVYEVDGKGSSRVICDGHDPAHPMRVRRNRLYRDATSQSLTSRTLCPDGALTDDLVLNYRYPSRQNAEAEGRSRLDVLDRAQRFFDETVESFEALPGEDPGDVEERREMARQWVQPSLDFYRGLRGRDFNDGSTQSRQWMRIDRAREAMAQAYEALTSTGGVIGRSAMDLYVRTRDEYYGLLEAAIDRYGRECLAGPLRSYERQHGLGVRLGPGSVTSVYGSRAWDQDVIEAPFDWERNVTPSLADIERDRVDEFGVSSGHLGGTPYFDAYGRPNGTYALFSVGGIHGAEYNKALFERERAAWEGWPEALAVAQAAAGGADDEAAVRLVRMHDEHVIEAEPDLTRAADRRRRPMSWLSFPDGREHYLKDFLRVGFSGRRARWKPEVERGPEPVLFVDGKHGDLRFDDRYTFTSVCQANHEDFKSYYPNLLDQMSAFENPDIGENRYHEMFLLKEDYGRQAKALPKGDPGIQVIQIKRNGVKLQLNTASGAGGAKFDGPVRMNNRILAMRVIGQLFSWQIGQTQASAGARVPSTNTDGLYTVLDEDLNNRLLADASADIQVLIEPEVLQLVSKDTNNRVEWDYDADAPNGYRILSCGGGDLAHWRGPNPTKNLAHPAIADEVLAHYLVRTAKEGGQEAFYDEFDYDRASDILDECLAGDPNRALVMLSLVISASPSVMAYPFAVPFGEEPVSTNAFVPGSGNLVFLEHYTRIYAVHADCGRRLLSVRRAEGAKGQEPASNGEGPRGQMRAVAVRVLEHNGVSESRRQEEGRYPRVSAVPNVPASQPFVVENHSVREMPRERAEALLADIDRSWYIGFVRDKWEKNWRNSR